MSIKTIKYINVLSQLSLVVGIVLLLFNIINKGLIDCTTDFIFRFCIVFSIPISIFFITKHLIRKYDNNDVNGNNADTTHQVNP